MSFAQKARFNSTAIDWIALDEIASPAVRFGADYWRTLRGDRRYPARSEIKPRDIAPVLSAMSLLKILDGGDYQYRIAGDAVVRAFDVSLQHRLVSEIEGDLPMFGRFVRPVLERVVQNRSPVVLRGRIGRDAPGANFTHHENALLPLGPNDDTVDYVLAFCSYERRAL